jgi:hypothetical protein
MDIYEAVKINALNAVVNPDEEYYLRFIFRWYSKTFHTPLHLIPDLPVIDILTAYYEELYEKMEKDDLAHEKLKSSMTPEEWAEKLKNEEMDDLAFMETIMSKNKVDSVKVPEQKNIVPVPPMDEGFSLSFGDVPI